MAAILLVALPYLTFHTLSVEIFYAEVMVSVGILVYCGLRLAWIAAQGRPRFLIMTFFAFIYVWVGLSGTAQIVTNHYPWPIWHLADDILPTLLTIVVTILAVECGYLSLHWRPPSAQPPRLFQRLSFVISDRAAAWLTVGAVALSLVGIVLYGPGNLFLTRGEMGSASLGTTIAATQIAEKLLRVPSLVAFTVVAYNGVSRWRSLRGSGKRFYLVMGAILLGLMLVTNYPPSLPRHWLGIVILTPAFALVRWRRMFAPLWILFLAAGLTILFPYLDLFRHANSIEEAFNKLEVEETVLEPLLSGHYDAWQISLNGYAYTEMRGPLMGDNLVGAAFFWFPRSVWRTKPVGSGTLVGKAAHYPMLNLSAPLWMEFYMAFGWLGLPFLMLLYGRVMASAERLYKLGLAQGGYHHLSRVLVPYWGSFQIYILRGDLMTATAFFSFGLLLFWLTALPSKLYLPGVQRARPFRPLNFR